MTQLLYGKERFLKDEALADLKTRLFRNPSELDLNFRAFDASGHGVRDAIDFLSTVPFLAEKRMAVLWGVDALSEADGERLLAALDGLPKTACLVLETGQTNTKKDALIRALAEKMTALACHTPFEKDLPAWIEKRSKKKGLSLERGVAAHLARRVGADLALLDGALNETALYIHPRKNASSADIDAITASNPEEDVFKLADLLLENRKKEALEALDGLFRSGARSPEIVGALGGQLERYKKALALLSAGGSALEIAGQMRVPWPHQNAFVQRLKGTSTPRLRKLQRALLECDESFKTGRWEERVSVERFVLTV